MIDVVAWVFWIALAGAAAVWLWQRTRKRCAQCTSWIPGEATRCRRCGAESRQVKL